MATVIGDGFQEYQTRSTHGFYNQGWKDAGDAIVEADGSLAPLPIATCELQGYVFDAKTRLAEVYDVLGRPKDARRLRREAQRLYERVNEVFWWEEEGTYVLGLNGRKEPIRSVASNAGYLLQSGIVPVERAGRVVKRLLADDMWSGWGIRTLSADHPAYNPFSYQRGSVWPHDNATRREASAATATPTRLRRSPRHLRRCRTVRRPRLPELFSGMPRVPASFPVPYLGANVPQAWAAGSVFRFVAVLCGLHATFERTAQALREPGAPRLAARGDDPQPARRERVAGDPLPRRAVEVHRLSQARPARYRGASTDPGATAARSAVAARSWQSHSMQAGDDPASSRPPGARRSMAVVC